VSRIETDYANLLVYAISLEKLARDEIARLSSERPNDPHTIESNKKQSDLLSILADGFARLAAALEEYSKRPQPFFAGKAKEVVDEVAAQFNAWWKANGAQAIDWGIRLPVMIASTANPLRKCQRCVRPCRKDAGRDLCGRRNGVFLGFQDQAGRAVRTVNRRNGTRPLARRRSGRMRAQSSFRRAWSFSSRAWPYGWHDRRAGSRPPSLLLFIARPLHRASVHGNPSFAYSNPCTLSTAATDRQKQLCDNCYPRKHGGERLRRRKSRIVAYRSCSPAGRQDRAESRTTASVPFQPELIALDREMVS
jgi:hypothetical protein